METPPIYLDYAATSPVDRRVAAVMARAMTLDGVFANPSSTHVAGAQAAKLVEAAREAIAARVGATAAGIVFTSGATEANNLALAGVLAGARASRPHVVTTAIEHKSVLDAVRRLERDGRCEASYLGCGRDGSVPAAAVAAALRPATALVSVMHVNNETGAVQDVASIAAVCRERGVLLHVDAAQSVGKLGIELDRWGVDLCSLTAHKVCGPKGVGALYLRPGVALVPLLQGGEQQRGLRPGTLATHQIVGMAEAFRLADPDREGPALAGLKARLWRGLAVIPDVLVNGDVAAGAPHILNVSFPGVEGESLRLALRDIAVSAGSACMAASPEASHVLTSLGRSDALASSSLRFSVGRFTTEREVTGAAARVAEEVERLRRLAVSAPAWCRT